MRSEPNLLALIQRQLNELNKSEAKVAHAILNAPEEATRSSIASLATAAGVSEPSVNRFCKRFGATGFPDFKLQLATSLASGVRYVSRAVEFSDDINSFPTKLFDNAINAIMTAKEELPLKPSPELLINSSSATRLFLDWAPQLPSRAMLNTSFSVLTYQCLPTKIICSECLRHLQA